MTERIQPDPNATIFTVWPRVKIWFECAYCPKTWESCAICRHGILMESPLWGQPGMKQLICRGGCGFSTSWLPEPPSPAAAAR